MWFHADEKPGATISLPNLLSTRKMMFLASEFLRALHAVVNKAAVIDKFVKIKKLHERTKRLMKSSLSLLYSACQTLVQVLSLLLALRQQ